MLPSRVSGHLGEHLDRVRVLHNPDLASGAGNVELPGALERAMSRAVSASVVGKRATCHSCGTPLLSTCWRPVMTFGRCRNCWGIVS